MIFLSQRFMAQVREYAALETRYNRSYGTQMRILADAEVRRQVAAGAEFAAVEAAIKDALRVIAIRFPFEWEANPF